ncbi:hypothetical protein Tco_0376919, partial [Tanacetum coccineum]
GKQYSLGKQYYYPKLMNHIFKLNRTRSYYLKRCWELLPKEILGATTQRDTGSYYPKEILGAITQKRYWELLPKRDAGSYYPKRYWELLPKEILRAITQINTGSYYPKRYWDVLWENGGNLGNNISG